MSSHTSPISPKSDKAPRSPQSLLFLRTTSEGAVSSRIITSSKSSYDIAAIVAAIQLVEYQERYGSDAVPPEDIFASWLEENRERFIEARRAARNRNASGSNPRSIGGTKSTRERVSSLKRTPNSTAEGKSPRNQGKRGTQEDGDDAKGIRRHIEKCRRRVCGMGKRVGRLLSRAGAAVHPADKTEQAQLKASGKEVVHDDSYPIGLVQGSEYTAENATVQEEQERGATSTSNNNRTMLSQQQSPQELPRDLPLKRIEGRSMLNIVDEPRPGTNGRMSYCSDTTTLGQSEREAAPSPPEQRGPFHISQVAHLAPSHIAAERSRERSLLDSHQSHQYDRVFQSNNIGSNNRQVDQYNGYEQRRDQDKSSSSLANRDTLQARIRDAGFLSGELWLDGLNKPGERVRLRFLARPLKKTAAGNSYGSSSGRGQRLLPRANGRKIYGLDY
ncbi:hypothetical protein F5Y06DRAFT_297703 [Hypoxylon sp. FL0890]|nr:hypothetical protein F5Y06DRAFT_297703 [Hypoxylon sp. FL0890]